MKTLKALVKNLPIVGNLAISVYRKMRPGHIYSSAHWVEKYIPNERLSIVQIGSNDGVSGDPLYQLVQKNKLWEIVFVEPVTYIFEKLKENYGNEARFKFENAAINADGKNQFFYSVSKEAFEKNPDLSLNYNQIGSFNKDQVLKLSAGLVDEYITALEVNCLTLNQLFEKNDVKSLDLFHIDAEGYDWKILSQLDLSKYKPIIIALEFLNLSETERNEALRFLEKDYYVFAFRIDYCCIRKDVIADKDLRVLKSRLLN